MRSEEAPAKRRKAAAARPLVEVVAEDGRSSFAKALGSVDFHTRERGVQALTIFLKSSKMLTPLAMRKLWKGLFYCFWHSDKAATQEALAARLAAILPQLAEEVALQYFTAFIEAMEREWFGIDKLRLDKFLMLVRKFVRQMFVHLHDSNWAEETVESYIAILKGVVDQSSEHTAAGLTFHLVDIFMPELLSVLAEERGKLSPETIHQLLVMFVEAMATSSRASLPPRIREGVFDPLIEEFRNPSEEQPLQSCSAAKLGEHIFQIGAKPGVRARARDILYELSSTLESCTIKKRKRVKVEPTHEAAPQEMALNGNLEESTLNGRETVEGAKNSSGKKAKRKARAAGGILEVSREGHERENTKPVQLHHKDVQVKHGSANGDTAGGKDSQRTSTETSPLGDSVGAGVGKTGVNKLREDDLTRAAERTAAAIGAQKQGMTTVNPSTPGPPSKNDLGALMKESLQKNTTPKVDKPPAVLVPSSTANAPATQSQQDSFTQKKLKRKSLKALDATPVALAPPLQATGITSAEGSALKQKSKFSRLGPRDGKSPPLASAQMPKTAVKPNRRLNTSSPHNKARLRKSI